MRLGPTTSCLLALVAGLGRAPAPGAAREGERVVERRFSTELELATERFELTGSEGELSEVKRPPSQVREQADEIELVDTILGDGEPPERFTRLYATVMSTFEVGDERSPRSKTASAALEGKTVTFERERDGSYARTSDDPELRRGMLKRLRAELSLAAFLPPEPGSEERWEVPESALPRLFSPLESELRRTRSGREPPKGGLDLSPAALTVPIGSLFLAPEGTLTATPRAADEDDELPRRADLAFRLTSTFDGSAALLGGLEAEVEDELELSYEGQGTLAWDPASGRIEVTCSGELRLAERFRAVVEGNGQTATIEGELVLRGTLAVAGSERRGE